jgi:D-alanyl-D-alanine carboxypeptidase
MIRLCLSVVLAVAALSCAVRQSQTNSLAGRQMNKVEDVRAKYSLPAMGAATISHDGVALIDVAGRRYLGADIPVTKNDFWHLGSNTKAMTAALIAMLVEERLFDWDTPLTALIDGAPVHPSYARATIGMVLTHHSGIPGDLTTFEAGTLWQELWNPDLEVRDGRKLVARRILGAPAESIPGSAWVYSNAGYIVLGHIIERVTKVSWEEALKQRLFTPLGMSRE